MYQRHVISMHMSTSEFACLKICQALKVNTVSLNNLLESNIGRRTLASTYLFGLLAPPLLPPPPLPPCTPPAPLGNPSMTK